MSEEKTYSELLKCSCQSFGGNNCVFHGCMFSCALNDAKVRALMKERGLSKEHAKEIVTTNQN